MSNIAISLCSLVVMLIAAILVIYSFMQIFQLQKAGENDLNVIQRQIRGFAILIVANLVILLGSMVCAGSLVPYILSLLA